MDSNVHILSELECPICKEYMTSQIFQCTVGHSVCEDCAKKLDICPTCREPFESTRNLTLESLAEKLKFPCQNANEGCDVNIGLRELQEHHKICIHRMYKCHLEQCEWQNQSSLLLNHFREKHQNSFDAKKWGTIWKKDELNDKVMFVRMWKSIFYFHQKIKDEIVFWILQYIGIPEKAKNFRYHIKINRPNKAPLVITKTCSNDIQTVDEIIEKKDCAFLSLSFFQKYIDAEELNGTFDVELGMSQDILFSYTFTKLNPVT